MTPSPASFPFVRALQQRGARVYTVGGTVRDELLGILAKTWTSWSLVSLKQTCYVAYGRMGACSSRGVRLG